MNAQKSSRDRLCMIKSYFLSNFSTSYQKLIVQFERKMGGEKRKAQENSCADDDNVDESNEIIGGEIGSPLKKRKIDESKDEIGDVNEVEEEVVEEENETHCLIGIDIGTQGAKAILYHPKSQSIKARASSPYDLDVDDISNGSSEGRAEQHPIKWIHALHKILNELSTTINRENYKVKGIGVSGQQHGMVALDNQYNVIRSAKLWCDVEASAQATSFSKQATQRMGKKWDVPAGFTAPKVLWMKQNEPQNWNKTKWVVLPHDYINLCLRTGIGFELEMGSYKRSSSGSSILSGDNDNENKDTSLYPVERHGLDIDKSIIPSTDAGDASGTGLLYPVSKNYVHDLAQVIDKKYFGALPKILKPSEIYGTLSPLWKRALNIDLHNLYSIPISVGSGDNMMSALGCQCVSPGNAVLSLGTSGTIFGVSLTPVETGTPVAPFCDATGKYLPLVCIMSCTGILNSVLENWCSSSNRTSSSSSPDSQKKMTHKEATELAKNFPPGCNGLSFLPYLGGERTPNWPHASGSLLGLNVHNMNCLSGGSPGLIYRAAMEGITFVLADALDQMRESCGDGFNPNSLLVVGGGSKNPFWRQMIADVFDLELRFPLEPESAALGAAFQAGAAASKMDVDKYVLRQKVEMEEDVVKPTTDRKVKELDKGAYDRHRKLSRKIND